ncbi:MAG: zinc dependent phospholipase C family protein, partial [Deltaproteobacteria bacterium]|nr:zinc dependent phospholipase C family protein [Deltaproteobacteria bacterium]
MIWVTLVAVVSFLLVPGTALAFGPVAHLESIRGALQAGAPALSFVTSSGVEIFWALLYGSIAPDLFVAKNRQYFTYHTHNWDRAFSMLDAAADLQERAFSLGYLAHLAGDVIAHNVFVPYKMVEIPFSSSRRHAYWEYRFETAHPPEAWESMEAIKGLDFRHLHGFLERHQRPTYLPFNTNLAVVRSLVRATTGASGRRFLDRMERRSEVGIAPLEAQLFRDLCLEAVMDVLERGPRAEVMRHDPRGMDRIRHAQALTVSLRRLWRRGFGGREHYQALAEAA